MRFVSLAPGAIDPRPSITLELRHASMKDGVPYAALSYVWGNVDDTEEIEINSESFSIGRNLYASLHQLRLNGVGSWLWIDSICIEQSNNEEKSWHVDQMRQIFSHADLV